MIVEYRVLGPLEVLLDGEPVGVPAGRGRVLLATLLLRPNEFVPVDELVERVWDGEPPGADRAHKTLQTVVMRLRQSLGAANCVRTSPRGYSAEVEPAQLDLLRFQALSARGEHRAALELWRGPVLGNVGSESLQRDDVPPLVEEYLSALEHRIDDDLARATDFLVPELRSLVRQHPLRETFWAQLMLALYRAGRQAEALDAYQEIRASLADELGVAPGQRLRDAQEQVLSGDLPAPRAVPRQLPPAHPHFVGREHELTRLTETLASRPGEPVVISAINGIGGVGKTALALEWAHQVAGRFPDGQLYVNLRGFDTRAEPLDPAVVSRDFLLALGVPDDEVPSPGDALVAAYRSALERRRVLLVLDNARDVDQVRPLLPGGSGNQVLITSRNRLSGLVVREGAQPVALDVLDEQASVVLLTERIGAARVAAEPDAVSRLVDRCAGLPLALGIVAARAAYGDSLTAIAGQLEQERLSALDIHDPMTDVRVVFSWSLRSLSDAAARTFVLLGLHPGPDFAAEAAASLAGLPIEQTRQVLDELVGGSLLGTTAAGRYVLHDLLREFAEECARELPEAERSSAGRRMVDHYVHITHTTWETLGDPTRSLLPGPPAAGALVLDGDWDEARSYRWYVAEYVVLRRLIDTLEDDDLVWRLVIMLYIYATRRLPLRQFEHESRAGLAAAVRTGDVFALSRMHRQVGAALLERNELVDAEHHIREALRFDAQMDDVRALLNVTCGLAQILEKQGRHEAALEALLEVHPRSVGHGVAYDVASHLAALGRAHHMVGDDDHALEFCEQATGIFAGLEELPDIDASQNQETIAEILTRLGRYTEAVDHYRESVRLYRRTGGFRSLVEALVPLAKACIAAGDPESARQALEEQLTLVEQLGYGETDEARDLLKSLA